MKEAFIRSEMLLGSKSLERLASAHVVVFGLGGVGSYVVEALARSGIGKLTLVDYDTISESNLNRQLIALHSNLGKEKTSVLQERIQDINPDCKVIKRNVFFNQEQLGLFDFSHYDYVVDAIDSVSSKLLLVSECEKTRTPIISAMGAGNKLDPTQFRVGDIFETSLDPLARVMRKELRKRNITALKVVYSTEEPIKPFFEADYATGSVGAVGTVGPVGVRRKKTPGSVAFVPSVAGLIIASEVVKDLTSA